MANDSRGWHTNTVKFGLVLMSPLWVVIVIGLLFGAKEEMAHATSPDRTWSVKLFGKWDSSYFVVWMESYDQTGKYLGRFDVAWLEQRDEAEADYPRLYCTDSESGCGNKKYPDRYKTASKSDFIFVPRDRPHTQ